MDENNLHLVKKEIGKKSFWQIFYFKKKLFRLRILININSSFNQILSQEINFYSIRNAREYA